MDWFWIAVGLVTLIGGADLLVRGAAWVALVMGMSKLVVGLTLVAFGTSAPELVVSVQGALAGKPGFATGSVLGSNIANLGLIVGCSALIAPIAMAPRAVRSELGFTITAGILPLLPLVFAAAYLERWFGVVLVGFVTLFTALLMRGARRAKAARKAERAASNTGLEVDVEVPDRPTGGQIALHVLWILLGLAGLYFGGNWLVDGATGVAKSFGMSDTLIGATIIAVGTSLPELATSIAAARKGHAEMGLGNVLGSNIFNVGLVLGVTSLIAPLPLSWPEEGLAGVIGLGMAIFLAAWMRATGGVSRTAALLLLLAYAGYLTTAVAMG